MCGCLIVQPRERVAKRLLEGVIEGGLGCDLTSSRLRKNGILKVTRPCQQRRIASIERAQRVDSLDGSIVVTRRQLQPEEIVEIQGAGPARDRQR